MPTPSVHHLQFDLPGLMQLLGSGIYTGPRVCIREMVQNAHDSCMRRTVEDATYRDPPIIRVHYDRNEHALTFQDNGSGLTRSEIVDYLATIGRGYTIALRTSLLEQDRAEAERLIGQFGIGLLAAFAIADRVVITTRSYQSGSAPYRWECRGDSQYTLEEISGHEIGSRATVYIQQKHQALFDETVLRETIKQYADLLRVPIHLGSERAPINVMTAPWDTDATDIEYAEYVRDRFSVPALEIIPIGIEDDVIVRGVLYIPKSSVVSIGEYGDVDVHVRRLFVRAGDRDLLPKWARFVRGVIDSPSLNVPVSRDALVTDDAYWRVQYLLGEAILQHLDSLARHDPRQLRSIVMSHNTLIKAWAIEDDAFFDRVADLVQFDSDVGRIALPDYLARTSDGRTIYYFKEAGSGTQQKVLFGARGIPVIDASYGAEESFLQKYAERHPEVVLTRLDAQAEVIFHTVPTEPRWERIEDAYLTAHRIEARVVAFEPVDLPAVLVDKHERERDQLLDHIVSSPNVSEELRSLFSGLKQERDKATSGMLTRGTVLHLNANNPVIRMLTEMDAASEVYHVALIVLFNNAVLFGQHAVTADNAMIMCRSNNKAVELMLRQAIELGRSSTTATTGPS